MKCVICKSDNLHLRNVDEEIKLDTDIVLLPLNILVCGQCGERYYDRKTLHSIEESKDKLRKKTLSVTEVGKVFRACAA